MKKILSIICATAAMMVATGCSDFLDTQNLTKKDTSTYPTKATDAEQLLTGVYSMLGRCEPLCFSYFISEIMSDDCFGGGDQADRSCKAIDQFKKSSEDMFRWGWRARYMGIYRANFLINELDRIEWPSAQERDRVEGEARMLRAFFYFDLSRMFGEVPLVTTPEAVNIPKTPAEETYAFIASDLLAAIEKIPARSFSETPRADNGRMTRWAAEALLGRVWLFYTGYYRREKLPTLDGQGVDRSKVQRYIDDCIDNSGHRLLADFRNLWPYSQVQDYAYAANNGLQWAGDGNVEEVMAIKYSTLGTWDVISQKCNQVDLYYGIRGQSNYALTFPWGQGWGFATVNPKLWNDWDDADPRKRGSIINCTDKTEMRMFLKGGGNAAEETFYVNKKHCPVNVYSDDTKKNVVNYSVPLYGMSETNFQLTNTQDIILIRYADVLLMGAELGCARAQDYLDQVRRRAGLESVPVTAENIERERRFELAFEGERYYDLLRWHKESLITENQTDQRIYDRKVPRSHSVTFRPQTGGFLPIPLTEIQLSEGVLTQNPGGEGSDNYLD